MLHNETLQMTFSWPIRWICFFKDMNICILGYFKMSESKKKKYRFFSITQHASVYKMLSCTSCALIITVITVCHQYCWINSWHISGFVTKVVWWVPLVEQELPTFPEHMSSYPVFSGVFVARSLVFCVLFCRSLFVPLSFFFRPLYCLSFFISAIVLSVLLYFGHCIVCPS